MLLIQCLSKILLFSFKLECEIIKNIRLFGFLVIAVYCCSSVYYKNFLLSLKRKLTMILKHIVSLLGSRVRLTTYNQSKRLFNPPKGVYESKTLIIDHVL